MKKLMLVAAAICSAAIANAAAITWGTGYLKGPADVTKSGTSAATGDLIKSVAGSTWTVTLKVFSDALGENLVASDAVKITVANDGTSFTAVRSAVDSKVAPTSLGTVASTFTTTAQGVKVTQDKWTQLTAQSPYYYQLVAEGGVADVWSAEKSSAIASFTTAADSSYSTLNASTATKLSGWADQSWTVTAAAAPEPTSGLLLLLGVAGLALKRKRA